MTANESKDKSKKRSNDDNAGASDKKLERKRRRDERAALLEQVPKVHPETGLSFTKQQLRRMAKRLARGLDPIETPREIEERKQRENELKREEEAQRAGDDDDDNAVEEGDGDDEEIGDSSENNIATEDVEQDDEGDDEMDGQQENDTDGDATPSKDVEVKPPKAKKAKRCKPVPTDYVCQACQNKHQPAHWIYDCPMKVTMPGTNQVSKHDNKNKTEGKGFHNPDQRKVFVSGLPFDVTKQDVIRMFENQSGPSASEETAKKAKVLSCKIITFSDTGRCKGQAILTFETEWGAALALKQMNGKVIDASSSLDKKKDGGKKADKKATTKKQLKIKVTKLLNRAITKKKQQKRRQQQQQQQKQ